MDYSFQVKGDTATIVAKGEGTASFYVRKTLSLELG